MANAQADIHHDDAHHAGNGQEVYFVPHGSKWPLYASVALFITMVGFATWLNEVSWGKTTFFVGLAGLLAILFKWFDDVIRESLAGHWAAASFLPQYLMSAMLLGARATNVPDGTAASAG